jgi:hypothetical protein
MKDPDKKMRSAKEKDDAWERFERAVDVALKTPPMHKEAPKKKPAKTPTKTKAKKA